MPGVTPVDRAQLAPGVELGTGEGGLAMLTVTGPLASGSLYLQGAHVTAWAPRHSGEVLWMSEHSRFAPGEPIRGGVPVVFPWFGHGPDGEASPLHGFARLLPWELTETLVREDGVHVSLRLTDSPATRERWPHAFEATYDVVFGETLELGLTIRNTGTGSFTFEEALHTYLAVTDVAGVAVVGLEEASGPLTVTDRTDRVFLSSRSTVVVEDSVRSVEVHKQGSSSTVVWNPWAEDARALPDFGDDEWPWLLCVETANVRSDAITLAPGAEHTMRATIVIA